MGWWYCPIKPPRVSGWVVGVVSADHHEFGLVLSWARLAPDGKTREVLCVVWVDNAGWVEKEGEGRRNLDEK